MMITIKYKQLIKKTRWFLEIHNHYKMCAKNLIKKNNNYNAKTRVLFDMRKLKN